ncbi:MAG: polymer-forming cytoskeletal protein [Candidatus Kryptoniota bacterium]
MQNQNRTDLRINGLGNASGGSFNFVQINGKGDINGDIDCIDLQINGLGCMNGNVKAESIRVAGKSEIAGNLNAQELIIDGMMDIHGGIVAQSIENRGMLKVNKDCGSEIFKSKGGLTINGLLNAGKINIEVYAPCKIKEIGGENIEIRFGSAFGLRKFIDSIFPGWARGLSAETIEGDIIYIEGTTAKVVRGKDVEIGPGCAIDIVEYKNAFKNSGDSKVKQSKKI